MNDKKEMGDFLGNYMEDFPSVFNGREEIIQKFRETWFPPKDVFEFVMERIRGCDPFIKGVPIQGSLPMINFKYEDNVGVIIFQWFTMPVAAYAYFKETSGEAFAKKMNPQYTPFIAAYDKLGPKKSRMKYTDKNFVAAVNKCVRDYYDAYTEAIPITVSMLMTTFSNDTSVPKELTVIGDVGDGKKEKIMDLSQLGGDAND